MKISNIQNNITHFNKINQKNYTSKPFISNNAKDILAINFTATKKQKPSQELLDTFQNKELRKEIIEDIIKDNDGNYREDIEKAFLLIYSNAINNILEEGAILTDDLKENMTIATIDAFKAVKDKDGTYDLSQNITAIALIAEDALENNVDDYPEIFKLAKDIKGKINIPYTYLISRYKDTYPEFSVKHLDYMFKNYMLDPQTRIINQESAPTILGLLSFANARTKSETDSLFMLITDGRGGYDQDKYEFAYRAIEDMQKIAEEEVDEVNQVIERVQINSMMYSIIGRIEENIIERYGKFDLKKALEAYCDWSESIQEAEFLYENEGALPRALTLNDIENGQDFEELGENLEPISQTSVYNSSLFKLFSVLCIVSKTSE